MLAAGHKVIITTGRPLVSARIQAQRLGLTGPGCCLIAYNGCILYDTFAERVLFRDALSLEDTYALFDEARRRGMHIQTYDETCCLAQEGADLARIEREIKEMPNYFDEYDTTVTFITAQEMLEKHSAMMHGGFVIRSGQTALGDRHVIEYSLKLESNPQFTSSILTACARAAVRFALTVPSG